MFSTFSDDEIIGRGAKGNRSKKMENGKCKTMNDFSIKL